MKESIRIAIVGVGGVGGYLGARLAATYQDDPDMKIIFIQRGEHLQAIRNNGITLITNYHTYKARPDLATDRPGETGHFTHVIFCVKSYDLEQSVFSVRNGIRPETVLITTLNGVDIERRLAKIYSANRILPGCIYVSAHIERPGVIRQVGSTGPFFFGPLDGDMSGLDHFEKIFQQAKIKAKLTKDIIRRLWEKYVFVSPLASVTSYYRATVGEMAEDGTMREMFANAAKEIMMIAAARGVQMEESILDDMFRRISVIPHETKTSLQRDIERGGKTERDVFTDYVVMQGRQLGIPTPTHDRLRSRLVRDRES